ncbi:hypothetical protein ACT3SP_13785 [Brachybacterium sp. AOP43-C2-M15]|uniref:hypothetical protein n=1 Tax=Brachybacterium sp. AOP43-C2-M15 TaxID=3457661 RepID=UPI004033FD74
MRRNYWWFFAAVAVASLAGLIRLLVVSDPADSEARSQMLSAALFVVAFGAFAVIARRAGRGDRAADASGPVRPAPTSDPVGVERGGRWDLDQVAAQLARDLEPLNGLVFREGGSRRLRVMLDPASAIGEHRPVRRSGNDDVHSNAGLRGQWWSVTWRAGRAPRIRERTTPVGVRIDADGRAIPLWSTGGASSRAGEHVAHRSALQTAQRAPAELEISSDELVRVVDGVAARSGWASPGQVSSTPRTLRRLTRQVSRRRTGGGTVEVRSRSTSDRPGTAPSRGSRVDRAEETSISVTTSGITTTSSSSTSWSTSNSALPPDSPLRGTLAGAEGIPPSPIPGFAALGRIMGLVGLGILAACVLATVIGLIAGMVWWASFIIIGSGLLFCLLFVLPWMLIGRSEARRGA